MLSTGSGKSVWHIPTKALYPQKSLQAQDSVGCRNYVSVLKILAQNLACLQCATKVICWVIISRIKDALVQADKVQEMQIETSNAKFSLSEAKENMEAYMKLTGSGFDLCCV